MSAPRRDTANTGSGNSFPRRWVLSFLKARGLDPEEDADGDVLFLLDNMKYVLHIKSTISNCISGSDANVRS